MARIQNFGDFQRGKRLAANTNTTPVINAGDALRQQRANTASRSTASTVNANDAQRQQRGTVVGGEVTSPVESFNDFQRNSRIDEHLTIEAQFRDTIVSNSPEASRTIEPTPTPTPTPSPLPS